MDGLGALDVDPLFMLDYNIYGYTHSLEIIKLFHLKYTFSKYACVKMNRFQIRYGVEN